ncbi:hypothetical protein BCR44DRAFT_293947 [Catenaria anguillulae PL171]|uniref:Uncharacterized protein n=1 Tax=Catenaria anguillulae PL171 TaxID=765915 RepID=A0A1Y2I150_9FUNG|nr:hypothetical protein BCR44DRAFT_293947 [Catenaria anguillulae PL171]
MVTAHARTCCFWTWTCRLSAKHRLEASHLRELQTHIAPFSVSRDWGHPNKHPTWPPSSGKTPRPPVSNCPHAPCLRRRPTSTHRYQQPKATLTLQHLSTPQYDLCAIARGLISRVASAPPAHRRTHLQSAGRGRPSPRGRHKLAIVACVVVVPAAILLGCRFFYSELLFLSKSPAGLFAAGRLRGAAAGSVALVTTTA